MKNGYVYCLRFRSTQFYVGSSNNPIQRLKGHKKSCLSKKPDNTFMSRVWKKYGEPELYILAKVPVEFLLEEEQKFIDLVFGKEGCLNLNPHADRPIGWRGRVHSEETKAKMSASNKGKVLTEETKARMSASQKGKVHLEEAKAKMSSSHKGKVLTEETKAKMSTAQKGRILSEETKAKLSASSKGKPKSEETKAKMSKPKSPETRAKISASKKGKVFTEEHKARMAESARQRWARKLT